MNQTLEIIRNAVGPNRNIGAALKELKVKRFCEVGVFAGENFRNMLTCEPEVAVAVDPWLAIENDLSITQERMDEFYQSLLDLQKKNPAVSIVKSSSAEAAGLYCDGFFDFVYIDANHTYPAVCKDLELWYPKVRSGGIFSGHDYKRKMIARGIYCGVFDAVNEFVKKHKLEDRFAVSHGRCPSWFILKP